MSGYLGDGYGQYGDHGDDDFRREMREGRDDRFRGGGGRDRDERFRGGDRDRDDRRGFMFDRHDEGRGRHEHDRGYMDRARGYFDRDDDDRARRFGSQGRGEGMDDRAVRAAEGYRSRYGTQGHEGQYGGGAMMDMDRHGGSERWDSDRERRHNFSGVGHFGTGSAERQPPSRSLHDHHYRSWREQQIAQLDRDYEEYCREHEQKFGSSFDSWRQQRRSQQSQQGGGMGAAMGESGDPRSEHQGTSGSRMSGADARTGSSLAGAQAGTPGDSALGGSASIAGSTTAAGSSDTRGVRPGDTSSSQPGGGGEIAGDVSVDKLAPGGGTTTSKHSKV